MLLRQTHQSTGAAKLLWIMQLDLESDFIYPLTLSENNEGKLNFIKNNTTCVSVDIPSCVRAFGAMPLHTEAVKQSTFSYRKTNTVFYTEFPFADGSAVIISAATQNRILIQCDYSFLECYQQEEQKVSRKRKLQDDTKKGLGLCKIGGVNITEVTEQKSWDTAETAMSHDFVLLHVVKEKKSYILLFCFK